MTEGSGATTKPAWPADQSYGAQPASTAAREAPIAALNWSLIGSIGVLTLSAEPSSPTRDEDPGDQRRGLLGLTRLCDFLALELGHVRALGRIYHLNRRRAIFTHRRNGGSAHCEHLLGSCERPKSLLTMFVEHRASPRRLPDADAPDA